jgi:hypothetical protein
MGRWILLVVGLLGPGVAAADWRPGDADQRGNTPLVLAGPAWSIAGAPIRVELRGVGLAGQAVLLNAPAAGPWPGPTVALGAATPSLQQPIGAFQPAAFSGQTRWQFIPDGYAPAGQVALQAILVSGRHRAASNTITVRVLRATDDTDGDGVSNLSEALAGRDPLAAIAGEEARPTQPAWVPGMVFTPEVRSADMPRVDGRFAPAWTVPTEDSGETGEP